MGRDAVITETLASFDIVGEAENESPAAIPVRKRRLSAVKTDEQGKVGRSRFAGNLCEDHPEWEHEDGTITIAIPGDYPCAKFSGLPGKGRGIKQPSALTILRQTTLEFVRPLLLIGMFIAGLYGFQHVVLHGNGGFHLLRPGSHVSESTGGVSNSSQHPTPSAVPSRIRSVNSGSVRHSVSVPTHSVVKR